jgi:hypothetical protein
MMDVVQLDGVYNDQMTPPTARLSVSLSGVGIRLSGSSEALAEEVRRQWSAYLMESVDRPVLSVEVGYHDQPRQLGPFRPFLIRSELSADRGRFGLPEGQVEVRHDGLATVELAPNLGNREFPTLHNLVRAALAWRLPDQGGLLVHAAGVVVEGRAYILVGPGGSGKSTFARLCEEAGCRVVSDDLVLVDGHRGPFELLGSPFHSTHRAAFVPGRWPLQAVLLPRHGQPPSWSPSPPLLAKACLTANLPFIAAGIEHDRRVNSLVDRITTDLACLDFTYGLDGGFVDLLRRGPNGA